MKTVETRGYSLPKKHLGMKLALIETPGPLGKKNGISSARIVGAIQFSGCFLYKDRSQWAGDYERHRVPPNDPSFSYQEKKPKWGWEIERVWTVIPPVPAPRKRGIVFSGQCRIPMRGMVPLLNKAPIFGDFEFIPKQ